MFNTISRILIIMVIAVALIACYLAKGDPTPYQPARESNDGGYIDWHVSGDIYQVQFAGNPYTSHETIKAYWARRARVLCIENGYTDFKPLGFTPDVAEQSYSAKIKCVK